MHLPHAAGESSSPQLIISVSKLSFVWVTILLSGNSFYRGYMCLGFSIKFTDDSLCLLLVFFLSAVYRFDYYFLEKS
jgi:hypothetical protein